MRMMSLDLELEAPYAVVRWCLAASVRANSRSALAVSYNRDIRPILSDNCLLATVPIRTSARPSCGWTSGRRP